MKIFWTILKLYSEHDFNRKVLKGHNSDKTIGGVTVLFTAHRLIVVYICENILDGIKDMERTRFAWE